MDSYPLSWQEENLAAQPNMRISVSNPSPVGGGARHPAALGYNKIDPRWIEPLHDTVKTTVAGFGAGTISDLAQRAINLRQKLFT